MTSKLNKEQAKIVENILHNVSYTRRNDEKTPNLYRVQGKAGTGKTHTVALLIVIYLTAFKRGKVLVTCISHLAKDNFTKALKRSFKNDTDYQKYIDNGRLSIKTIASALNQFKVGWDGFSPPDNSYIRNYDLVVVDEFSSVGDKKTLSIIKGLSSKSHCLFCGDYAQLPPVMAKSSSINNIRHTGVQYAYGMKVHSYELTRQMRQSGVLEAISNRARGERYYPTPNDPYLLRQFSDAEFRRLRFYSDESSFLKSAVNRIKTQGAENVTVISWRNKEVTRLASLIRKQLYPDNPSGFNSGETLRVFKGNKLYPKTSLITLNLQQTIDYCGFTLYQHLNINTGENQFFISRIEENKLNRTMKLYEKMFKYTKKSSYKDAIDFFSDIPILSYPYSTTAHSCQGITVPYVYINLPDLKKCTLKNILMVAYSRASEQLHILQ